jgi:hypothetical protein
MNTETLARLISGADHLSFRDLSLEYLASRGYKEVTSTDGAMGVTMLVSSRSRRCLTPSPSKSRLGVRTAEWVRVFE